MGTQTSQKNTIIMKRVTILMVLVSAACVTAQSGSGSDDTAAPTAAPAAPTWAPVAQTAAPTAAPAPAPAQIPFTCKNFTAQYHLVNKVPATTAEKQAMWDEVNMTKFAKCAAKGNEAKPATRRRDAHAVSAFRRRDARAVSTECTEATKCLADAKKLLDGVLAVPASAAGLYSGVAVLVAVIATLF